VEEVQVLVVEEEVLDNLDNWMKNQFQVLLEDN